MIVEDDLDIADMLNAYFRVQGYEVITVNWGEDGVRACQINQPDLVILDIRLPDIDGFEVAQQLRTNRRTKDIPIIFLTEKRDRADKLKGLGLSADDYITKPFDIQELRLRARNAINRAKRGSLTNPITGLPEGNLVDDRLTRFLNENGWNLLVITLGGWQKFHEVYGFVASDDLLRAVSLMIQNTFKEFGSKEDFLGHLKVTTFLVVTRVENLNELKDRLRKRLEQSFGFFYRHQDRESGLFQDQPLTIQISELTVNPASIHDVNQLKKELERLFP